MKKEKDFSKFNALKRFIALIMIFAVIIGCSCFSQENFLSKAKEVKSIDSLSGQRIGCCSGWETDLLLTPRDDITLMRYESNAEALMALSYNQVDAVGMDESSWGNIKANTSGLETVGEPIAHIGFIICLNNELQDIADLFNEFNAEFQASDEYEDFVSRMLFKESSTFTNAEIETIPEDKAVRTLKVGYNPENYPETYINATTGEIEGYAVELLERFAKENNFALEWIPGSGTSLIMDTKSGKLDIYLNMLTDVFREAAEAMFIVPDAFAYSDVVLVKIADGQKLKINAEIQE